MPQAGNPPAFNRYAYSYNSPLVYVDPSGHCTGNRDDANDPDAACWSKMGELESYWGVEFRNVDRWKLEYLEYLADVFSEMGSLVGGDIYLQQIIARSAAKGGEAKFWIGAGDEWGFSRCWVGCGNYGWMWFAPDKLFSVDFGKDPNLWGPLGGDFFSRMPNTGKVIMGHELGHIVTGIVGDWSYRALRGWEAQDNGAWTVNDGGPRMTPDPNENLAQLIGIRVSGHGWDKLDPDQAALQIAPMDQAYVDRFNSNVPFALTFTSAIGQLSNFLQLLPRIKLPGTF